MYCEVGENSDVSAYFHVMGHFMCETCDQSFRSKGGLITHLREHQQRGDRVPQPCFDTLHSEQEAMWEQAVREGRNSIRRPKPLGLVAKALMVIINL